MRIAIQGEKGSFHDEAAHRWFGDDIVIVPGETFGDVFESVRRGDADAIVVAIENSLYGGINPVYDLIESYEYPIIGEVHLPIHQQLIGRADSKVTHIYSHPVALAQCENYLDIHYPGAQRVEYHDTAAAVEFIAKHGDGHWAAIASEAAAQLHDVPIIAADIEDNPANYTRFLVLRPHGSIPVDADRTSLVLTTNHTPGALAKVLTVLAERNINLSKLQSRPIIGSPWKYRFYLVLDTAGPALHEALAELRTYTQSLIILGEYRHDTTDSMN
jgi:prephenate dehydratase